MGESKHLHILIRLIDCPYSCLLCFLRFLLLNISTAFIFTALACENNATFIFVFCISAPIVGCLSVPQPARLWKHQTPKHWWISAYWLRTAAILAANQTIARTFHRTFNRSLPPVVSQRKKKKTHRLMEKYGKAWKVFQYALHDSSCRPWHCCWNEHAPVHFK